jgi:hypothetical protein
VSHHDHEPGSVDWLDLGPDPDEGRRPPDPRRRYLWYGAAAALVAVALLLTQTQHGTNRAATSPRPPSATATLPRAVPPSPASSSSGSFVDPPPTSVTVGSAGLAAVPQGGRPKVTRIGHPLLDVPADWELFARGSNVVVRIQLALGRVTTTAVPVANHDAPVAFLVGSDRAMVRSVDDSIGYVVRDGRPVTESPPALRHGAWILPSPDQRHLWMDLPPGDDYGIALLTLDGTPTGTRIEVPFGTGVLGPDGAGYVMLSGIGGVYDARPGRIHRITSGIVLAAGPTRWLTVECDDSFICRDVVVDRASGARHSWNGPVESLTENSGTISPDGRTAALPRYGGISLVDLDSGAERPIGVALPSGDNSQVAPLMVWSPDSRWLFLPDSAGRIMVIDRATGRATALQARLPPVEQLILRHGAG